MNLSSKDSEIALTLGGELADSHKYMLRAEKGSLSLREQSQILIRKYTLAGQIRRQIFQSDHQN